MNLDNQNLPMLQYYNKVRYCLCELCVSLNAFIRVSSCHIKEFDTSPFLFSLSLSLTLKLVSTPPPPTTHHKLFNHFHA